MSLTGNTPLIPVDRNHQIWAKLETHNRTGSVKDRMIDHIMSKELQYKNVTDRIIAFNNVDDINDEEDSEESNEESN